MTPVDISVPWTDWMLALVVNDVLVTDPTTWQTGFYLLRHSWSLLNGFWTGETAYVGCAKSRLCQCG